MTPGDVVLARMPQAAGAPTKLRPALVLAPLPGPYQTAVLCGISTRWQSLVPGWDEMVQPGDSDFAGSGLHRASAIRLSFLYAATPADITGFIGHIDPARLARLRQRLSDHLRP
jgi:mRNA interferase MazF